MVASGTTGTIAVQSEAIMQDYKAGHIIGSTPRYLTYVAAHRGADRRRRGRVDVPAAARDLRHRRRHGLSVADLAAQWAGFAEFLTRGVERAAAGTRSTLLVIFAVLGIVIAILEGKTPLARSTCRRRPASASACWCPARSSSRWSSAAWSARLAKAAPDELADKLAMPLASGLIAGEAIVAVVIPLLIAIGLLSPR